jgi:hypothetical protein
MSTQPEHRPGDDQDPQHAPTLRQARTNPPGDAGTDGDGAPGRTDRKPYKGNGRSDARQMRSGEKGRSQRSTPPGKSKDGRGFTRKGDPRGKSTNSGGFPKKSNPRAKSTGNDRNRDRDDTRKPREDSGSRPQFRRQNKPERTGGPRSARPDGTGRDRSSAGRPRPDRKAPRRNESGDRRGGARRDAAKPEEQTQESRLDLDPIVPADVTGDELDAESKAGLKTLPKDLAAEVARHLVMAGRLLADDPEEAHRHTVVARRKAARVGVVREACGLTAYHAGLWSLALTELRTARRLTGQEGYLAVMADAERGLGRPERALDLARSEEARRLTDGDAVEMRIVESGARRDLGQHDAAILALQIPELKEGRLRPWSVRLFYAYADALAEAGRTDDASEWFARAAAADRDGDTDAAERYAELEGLEIIDADDD